MSIQLFVVVVSLAIIAATETQSPEKMTDENFKLGTVLITHKWTSIIAQKLLERNFDVIFPESIPPTREEVLKLVNGTVGLVWAGHLRLDAEVLDAAGPTLKAISTVSAGLDHVDVAEVKRRGIPLGYTPTVLNDAVADMAIGLMIAASRRFREGQERIAKGNWNDAPLLLGKDIRGSRVGIVGLGGIGQEVAMRLKGFKVGKVVYTGRNRKPIEVEKKCNAEFLSFDKLVETSDFVVVTVPLTNETRDMFNETVFNKMKNSSVLVNVARGEIVNQKDLFKALNEQKIYSAGLDVMNPEPLPRDDPLIQLDNAYLMPHLGSATEMTRHEMAELAAHNVIRGYAGEPMLSPVP